MCRPFCFVDAAAAETINNRSKIITGHSLRLLDPYEHYIVVLFSNWTPEDLSLGGTACYRSAVLTLSRVHRSSRGSLIAKTIVRGTDNDILFLCLSDCILDSWQVLKLLRVESKWPKRSINRSSSLARRGLYFSPFSRCSTWPSPFSLTFPCYLFKLIFM